MSGATFEVVATPDDALARAAAATAPDLPMLAPAFAAALSEAGERVMLLTLRDGTAVRAACYARMRQGRLTRTVEVDAWPDGGEHPVFVRGFAEFCRRERVDVAELNTFGVARAVLPPLAGARRQRCEHRWDLRVRDLPAGLSTNHRRNLNRARRAGLVLRIAQDDGALQEHARLASASMERRTRRGEQLANAGPSRLWRALLASGAGRLYQATAGDQVLSSILVLAAAEGAYYQSAGTLPEGMEVGASQFVICETAARLAADGIPTFNLGGAEESNAGLYRFKTGFGTRAVPLEAGIFEVGSPARRRLRALLGAVRRRAQRAGSGAEDA